VLNVRVIFVDLGRRLARLLSGQRTMDIKLNQIIERMAHMADQADINAIAQQISDLRQAIDDGLGAMNASIDNVIADVQALQTRNPNVDATQLLASVSELQGAANRLTDVQTRVADVDAMTPPVEQPAPEEPDQG
jgi:hypothetical protein